MLDKKSVFLHGRFKTAFESSMLFLDDLINPAFGGGTRTHIHAHPSFNLRTTPAAVRPRRLLIQEDRAEKKPGLGVPGFRVELHFGEDFMRPFLS